MKTLQLNSASLFTEFLGYACPHHPEKLKAVQDRHALWTGTKPQGTIHSGYRRQVLAKEGLAESAALAKDLRSRFDTMIVLGIGGSALGARTVLSALSWQTSKPDARKVVITDNLDPIDFELATRDLDLKKTVVALITKSGGTIETMAQASVLLQKFEKANLKIADHFVGVTDPESGALRSWVKSSGLRALSVPPDVGGRFSVFTPVGILPLAFAGIDVAQLMQGAIDQFRAVDASTELAKTGLRLAELEAAGYTGKVLMPYATLLKDFGAWFVQLWGESLGKISFTGKAKGALPVAAVGATDQHSLLQMLVEGADRMSNGFLKVKDWSFPGFAEPEMLPLPKEFTSLKFAEGKSFAEILNAECAATQSVLSGKGRPVYEVELASLSPASLGALFALYMDLVVYTAAASDVNPFDQPGVELGKKILPSLLK